MRPRKKTAFEKWFSLSRHKRRSGAKKLAHSLRNDFQEQKKLIISGDEVNYTHGSSLDIEDHFNALRKEFIGQSELSYTHAKLVVLIRREFQTQHHFKLFESLWEQEKKFLLSNLNSRWLVAAADTLADHSNDHTTQTLALNCSILVNTLKLIETERFITNTLDSKDDLEKINFLKSNNRLALFDGTSAIAVGTDDTLRNMRWRMDKIAKNNIAGKILTTLFDRLHIHDTIYKRFKDRHTRKRTGWW